MSLFDFFVRILLTRRLKPWGKAVTVAMSLGESSSYEETLYLLRSPANARRLMDAVAELDGGKSKAPV